MPLDDALAQARRVLADYEASGQPGAPGPGQIWPGRLARALRDLAVAAGHARSPGPPASSAVVLSAEDLAAIGQALDDAAAGRAMRSDPALRKSYADLRARQAVTGGEPQRRRPGG